MQLFEELIKAFRELETTLPNEELKKLTKISYAELKFAHFGLGTWIRNHFFIENSKLYQLFAAGNILQKDDMSALFLNLFYLYLQTKNGKN